MPQTALPLQIPTSQRNMPRYHGEQPIYSELQPRDALVRQLRPIYGPPSLVPVVGFDGRTMLNPTNGMTYAFKTPLPDYRSMGFGHPTMLIDRNRIPLRPPPDQFTPRVMPNSPRSLNVQAPSLQQVASFMGGFQNG